MNIELNKRGYLNELLLLCTDRQRDLFKRMYGNGPNIKQLTRAIQQVEETLRDTDSKLEQVRTQKKELEGKCEELQKDAREAATRISQLERELLRTEHHIERLQGPSVDENAETLRKLALLDALEAAGVDNWDGYDYALDQMNS